MKDKHAAKAEDYAVVVSKDCDTYFYQEMDPLPIVRGNVTRAIISRHCNRAWFIRGPHTLADVHALLEDDKEPIK